MFIPLTFFFYYLKLLESNKFDIYNPFIVLVTLLIFNLILFSFEGPRGDPGPPGSTGGKGIKVSQFSLCAGTFCSAYIYILTNNKDKCIHSMSFSCKV